MYYIIISLIIINLNKVYFGDEIMQILFNLSIIFIYNNYYIFIISSYILYIINIYFEIIILIYE